MQCFLAMAAAHHFYVTGLLKASFALRTPPAPDKQLLSRSGHQVDSETDHGRFSGFLCKPICKKDLWVFVSSVIKMASDFGAADC